MDDLVKRDGLYYKKFSDVPFTGEIEGSIQGRFKNGKKEGPWVSYWSNGQLDNKGDYKNGKREGPWVGYYENGQLRSKGAYKNDVHEGAWVFYTKGDTVPNGLSGVYKNGVWISD